MPGSHLVLEPHHLRNIWIRFLVFTLPTKAITARLTRLILERKMARVLLGGDSASGSSQILAAARAKEHWERLLDDEPRAEPSWRRPRRGGRLEKKEEEEKDERAPP